MALGGTAHTTLPIFLSLGLLTPPSKSHTHTCPPLSPLSFLLSPACPVISTKSPSQSPSLFPLQLPPLCSPPPPTSSLSWKIPEARAGGTTQGLHADRAKAAQRGALCLYFLGSGARKGHCGRDERDCGGCWCTQGQKPKSSWVSGLPFAPPQSDTHTIGLTLTSVPSALLRSFIHHADICVGLTSSSFAFIPECSHFTTGSPLYLPVGAGWSFHVSSLLCSL